jgi:argininosuccinate synthase
VIAYVADVGQQEDFDEVAERARRTGARRSVGGDLKREFVTDFIFPAIAGNAVYENRYLLGTALARPVIAKRQVEVARSRRGPHVAHGATGKGNDQVRFELAYAALAPRLQVIAPWKDREFLAALPRARRPARLRAEHDIPVEATVEKPYSSDENLMHRSYEAGMLEDPCQPRRRGDVPLTRARRRARRAGALGDPLQGRHAGAGREPGRRHRAHDPLALFVLPQRARRPHGVGRVDMVENRFVGIKSRGVYETPGGTILHHALRDLEGIAMDREVLRLRDMLSPRFAELIYNGFWFSPEMDFIRPPSAVGALIDGRVRLQLYKGNVSVQGRESPSSLYDRELSSMDVEGGYDQEDARGFIRINALRLRAHKLILRKCPGWRPRSPISTARRSAAPRATAWHCRSTASWWPSCSPSHVCRRAPGGAERPRQERDDGPRRRSRPGARPGRLAADLIWFSSRRAGLRALGVDVTTGSSIMPQKRNPDALELVRAGVARLRGRHAEVAAIVAPLASGYHRDLQLTKEPFLRGLADAIDLLRVMRRVLAGVEVDAARCAAALTRAAGATDEVYRRVAAGRPFRDAYREVAADPAAVTGDPAEGWRLRTHLGAPGALELAPLRARLSGAGQDLAVRRRRIDAAWALLD